MPYLVLPLLPVSRVRRLCTWLVKYDAALGNAIGALAQSVRGLWAWDEPVGDTAQPSQPKELNRAPAESNGLHSRCPIPTSPDDPAAERGGDRGLEIQHAPATGWDVAQMVCM